MGAPSNDAEAPPASASRAGKGDRAATLALLAVMAGVAKQGGVELSPKGIKSALLGAVARDPMEALSVTVLGGAYLFFLAERGANPKVTTYWDALVFVSTSLSVGYADIFARTPTGQAIASALMTFGPALSGAVLESPAAPVAAPSDEALAVQRAILDKLDAILGELRKERA